MTRVKIAVCGDDWCNRDDVVRDIAANAGQRKLVFEVNNEGPSLYALGIVDTILEESAKIGIGADQIWIDQWHNTVEIVPFQRVYKPLMSHFFWMCDRYRSQKPDALPLEKTFGLFVGRVTPERAVIMYELHKLIPDQVLFSLMQFNGHETLPTRNLSSWIFDPHQQQKLYDWFHKSPITSITGHCVRDQYVSDVDTNSALIRHYDRFAVEIVCESYCRGDTFFPTEKTIRPLSQGKPILVYGPRNFLARLRDLGFKTWGDIWDETYDHLEGPKRWLAMKSEIQRILANTLWKHSLISAKSNLNCAVLDYIIAKHAPQ